MTITVFESTQHLSMDLYIYIYISIVRITHIHTLCIGMFMFLCVFFVNKSHCIEDFTSDEEVARSTSWISHTFSETCFVDSLHFLGRGLENKTYKSLFLISDQLTLFFVLVGHRNTWRRFPFMTVKTKCQEASPSYKSLGSCIFCLVVSRSILIVFSNAFGTILAHFLSVGFGI